MVVKMTHRATVFFPMAGRGARFGHVFKPFLPIGQETFIEAAVRPFRKWASAVERLIFVFLEEQDIAHHVTARLTNMFQGLPIATVVLQDPTRGPAETLVRGVAGAHAVGPAIVCDCDHSVNVDPLFAWIDSPSAEAEAAIPVWDLTGENPQAWSIASVEPDGSVTAIAEKRFPEGKGEPLGVVGCYCFRHIEQIADQCARRSLVNISDVIGELIAENRTVAAVRIEEAEFFGDPSRLQNSLRLRTPAAGDERAEPRENADG